ncbi:chromate resistance protein ChrB domain-containing protein [Sphingomonas sp. S2-65]|uniref:chromate resistance protein ChrB domain-containing protein n=1 Tax=Sphingomonas sp. S2-65 TaxID=2903960 RepID=UPI001F2AD79B|nr:sulfurtransferase/chromate resistance protein [Sphingomonas sp. S2-65]UYY59175.1 sulfurtransferase/chromate resistance protein [Sphingomonas sp. S2-65]
MPSLNHIAPDKLVRLIGTPTSPTIIDVRATSDTARIPGSILLPADSVETWSGKIAGSVVLVDEDGSSSAQAAAAWLRTEGVDADVLEGGVAAWREASLPTLDVSKLPRRDARGGTVWVTRSRPKVDRIACPWLIRRFIDPRARFLFAPAADVLTVAHDAGATPFDVAHDDVFWSHRGERCTFDLMVAEFGLTAFAGLDYLSSIVRGADTGKPELVPEAAGLLAVSLGLSRMHGDDLEQLEAGMPVYDALYRWCRDARSERHDWASHTPREVRS